MTAPLSIAATNLGSRRMRAIVQDRYGGPETLALRDIDIPTVGDDGVLVRVHATSVNAADWHLVRGRPYFARLTTGVRRPKRGVPGSDVAGVVEAVGRDVTELRPGDEVFGAREGAFAEYVLGRVRDFVPKPAGLGFEQAAAIPLAATTALQALRDQGQLRPGQRVLVLGAGGGVGSFAVQLAKALGAEVTATTSPRHLEMVRAIGADEVVDYTREDVTRNGPRFDLILDVGGYRSLGDLRRASAPGGTIVVVGAGNGSSAGLVAKLSAARLRSRFLGQRMRFFVAHTTRADLLVLREHAEGGRLVPVIERTYELAEIAAAVRHAETGQARGKVVVRV